MTVSSMAGAILAVRTFPADGYTLLRNMDTRQCVGKWGTTSWATVKRELQRMGYLCFSEWWDGYGRNSQWQVVDDLVGMNGEGI